MKGGAQQRRASSTAKKQGTSNVAAQQKANEDRARQAHAEGLDTLQRGFEACIDARNYSLLGSALAAECLGAQS